MPTYELLGEPLAETLPAHVESMKKFGVELLRIIGTEEQVTDTTKILDAVQPKAWHNFGDAQPVGFCQGADKRPLAMYELIVLRKTP